MKSRKATAALLLWATILADVSGAGVPNEAGKVEQFMREEFAGKYPGTVSSFETIADRKSALCSVPGEEVDAFPLPW
jgi:hypothetical protein